jgi:dTDP-4-dehydrorhamnose reductase
VVSAQRQDVDVSNFEQVSRFVVSHKPDVVINTAAFHKVEECERNPDLSLMVNAVGPANLARVCAKSGASLVHFSTDYVFGGDGRKEPFTEAHSPSPLNVYGVSKVAGEQMIPCYTQRYFIVRTAGLYGSAGSSGKGGNFVENTIKRAQEGEALRVVDDQITTPTSTTDLSHAVRSLIASDCFGLYHLTCEGQCSWYEFAREILSVQGIEDSVVPVSTADFPSTVRRPSYSVLSKEKAKTLGIEMPHWKDVLRGYLERRTLSQQHAAGSSPAPVG